MMMMMMIIIIIIIIIIICYFGFVCFVYRSFATTVSQLKMCHVSGETF